MAFHYKVNRGGDSVNTVVAFRTDAPAGTEALHIASSHHPHFQAIVDGLAAADPDVWALFDVAEGTIGRLRKITPRISWDGKNVLWDGDPVHSVLADQLTRAIEAGESNIEALAKFWELLESNPNEHSKTQAYTWLASHDFKITGEGFIVGYKGVRSTPEGFESITRGTAFVDGVKHTGAIPNAVGSVVTMPRSEVAHDPSVACHYGLHVGDWSYASDFAQGAVLEVHVNPAMVVSVPTDRGGRKLRTCEYTVVSVVEREYTGGPVLKPENVAPSWSDVGYATV